MLPRICCPKLLQLCQSIAGPRSSWPLSALCLWHRPARVQEPQDFHGHHGVHQGTAGPAALHPAQWRLLLPNNGHSRPHWAAIPPESQTQLVSARPNFSKKSAKSDLMLLILTISSILDWTFNKWSVPVRKKIGFNTGNWPFIEGSGKNGGKFRIKNIKTLLAFLEKFGRDTKCIVSLLLSFTA